jgi:hypothetical protein
VLAGVEAGLASVGATLAVLVLMLGAFGVAFPANLDALLEDVHGVVGAAGNEGGGETADVGAVAVEANAGHHHGNIGFGQAGVGTHFAGSNAAAEGVEDGRIIAAGAVFWGGLLHKKTVKLKKTDKHSFLRM